MQSAPQNLLKEYVQSQHFTSTADIMQAMKEMFRDVIQTVMEVEMDEELGRERCERARSEDGENTRRNYRNGYSQKTVKTQLGEVEIKVPRDRNGSYEPKIIGKYDRNADGMEEKILTLYACGMSQRDISEQIKELYDVDISCTCAFTLSIQSATNSQLSCDLGVSPQPFNQLVIYRISNSVNPPFPCSEPFIADRKR